MKKMKIRVMALLGALALTAFGMTGCSHGSGGGGGSGTLTDGALSTSRKTSSAPGTPGKITLYKNGSSQGTKNSVAEALKAILKTGSDVWTIELEEGTYRETEQLTYNGSATVKITGKPKTPYGSDVLIRGVGNKDDKYYEESHRSMFEIYGTGDIILEYVRMEHSDMMESYKYIGSDNKEHNSTQREVIGHQSSGTLAAYSCSFISRQDTIRTQGKAWFYDCYIEGDVDFLWIESNASSKVALYENCVLRAVDDRTQNAAYFTAPRLPPNNTVGKGVVILNSTLEGESGLKNIYLGRNPWDKASDEKNGTNYFNDYYEQVAIVGSKYYGQALNEAIWSGSGAHGTPNQQFVGFKTDGHFPQGDTGAIIGSNIVSAEYAGRNNILNRVYNVGEGYFQQDNSIWDIAAVISKNGWSAKGDSSSSKLDGDSTKTNVTYDFSSDPSADGTLDKGGFDYRPGYGDLHAGNADATMTFWIVGNCTITVGWNWAGYGTISCNGTSKDFGADATGQSGTVQLQVSNISSPTKVSIKTKALTYINSIEIQYTSNVDAAWAALKAKLAANTTYDFKLATAGEGKPIADGKIEATSGDGDPIINISNFNWHKSDYGLNVYGSSDNTMQIPVTGACRIYVNVSYVDTNAVGSSITINNNKEIYSTTINNSETTHRSWSISGAGNVTLTASRSGGSFCIGSISVIYVE